MNIALKIRYSFNFCLIMHVKLLCFVVGLVILLKPVLKYVPYAVLYGIFVYMGVSCLGSLQIYERIKLIFMPRKNYPSVAYARDVRNFRAMDHFIINKPGTAQVASPVRLTILERRVLDVLGFFARKFTKTKRFYYCFCLQSFCLTVLKNSERESLRCDQSLYFFSTGW